MGNWVKIWAPIIIAAGIGLVYAVMPSFFSDMSIWVSLLLLFFGVSLIFVSIYMLLHEFIYKYYEGKKLCLLVIIILIIGFVFGIGMTHLFYKDKVEKLEKSVLTPKQIESNVRNWLDEYRYNILKVPDEKEHFYFIVKSKSGKQTTIKLSKLEDTFITLHVKWVPTSDEQKAINKWSSRKLNDTLVKIKKSLASIELSFILHPQLKQITLNKTLFVDSLTKTSLFDALNNLNRAQAITLTHLHESFVIIP